MLRLVSPSGIALGLLAVAHGIFTWNSRDLRADLSVIAAPPTARVREVLAFGDHQFLYRVWALDLQNAGDTGGRATPLRNYNYDYVVGWLESLLALDPRAEYHMYLAAHYFALTPNVADVRRIVAFLVQGAETSPDRSWPWLMQAAVLAQTRLQDLPYALSIAERMARHDFADMPPWVLMFPAVLLEKLGRYGEARAVIEDIQARKKNLLTDDDRQWALNFLRRLPLVKE